MPAIGVTKGAISASGGTGVVVVSGFLKGINTSTYTAGDTLYVANGGGFTTSLSNLTGESNLIENLGKVVKSDASAGSIIVTGAGRANATPNLNDGNFFLGNASNQAVSADFTTSVRGEISATDAGGDGSFSYNSGTGVFTYTGPSAAETREHFTGGTGVTITNGDIAIGQAVGTGDNVTFNTVTAPRITTGPGSDGGSVALTVNDSYGNANVTFNHEDGTPDRTGNAGRIRCNVDSSTGAKFLFQLKSGVTANTAVPADTYLTVNEQGIDVNGTIIDSKGDVRDIPNSSTTGTLAAADAGKYVPITANIAVPSGVFTAGDAVTIFNNSTSNKTITTSGVTVFLAGTSTTGNRTLAQRGLATLLCLGSNNFVISGVGLT
jgi:hypothetical protein